MKHAILLFGLLLLGASNFTAYSQVGETELSDSTLYKLTKNDGTVYVGHVVKKDAREVLIRTTDLGDIYVPKHEIKSLEPLKESEMGKGGVAGLLEDAFSSRYYFSTSGLPIGKKKQYVVFNWYGPEYHMGVGNNLDIGVMTSWIGIPLVFSAKYCIPLSKDLNLGVGTLLGTISWIRPSSVGALPYAALTWGDGVTNFTVSGGYATWSDPDWDSGAWVQPMASVGSLIKLSNKVSFVFETLMFLPQEENDGTVLMITPGLRFDTSPGSAFQFGLTAFRTMDQEEDLILPFPNLSWYRSF